MSRKKQIPAICLFLIVIPLIAFRQLNHCDFINLDDPFYVTENIHIQNGITTEAIRWAFTATYVSNWHPLTWISHMLDIQLFGLLPGWHHLTNLLFHVANTLLLFFVLHRMTKAPWQSGFVAALFALHPLHVESVAWVAERKDVLSTFFWMLTMVAYVYYVENRTEDGGRKTKNGRRETVDGKKWTGTLHPLSSVLRPPSSVRYSAVLAFFSLGLMAKPMLVTLPFVLLLLDYWPLRRIERWASIGPLLREKIPLFALTAFSCIVTFIAQEKGGAVKSLEALPPGVRIANGFVAYITYIGKTIWPRNLAVYYPPELPPLWQVLGAVLLLTAATSLIIWKARKFPYLAVGWLWFAGTLVPVIGLVQVGSQAMADRYTYIPLIGLFIMAAWGVPELLKGWRHSKEVLFGSSAAILLCLFMLTRTQVGYWHDSIALYDHTLRVTRHNELIHYNRGVVYAKRGNFKEALEDFNSAIAINPRYVKAYDNRGAANSGLGNYKEAIEDFGRAIAINPRYVPAYDNQGVIYNTLGNRTEALADFNKAIDIDPGYALAYNHRGALYGNLGDEERAIADFNKAIEIDPKYTAAYYNRALAYSDLGKHKQAIEDLDTVIQISPEFAKAYYYRGVAYGELGNRERAIEDFKTAARLGDEEAKKTLLSRGIKW